MRRPRRGIPARTAGGGLGGRPQFADREPLERRRCRAPAQECGGIGRTQPRRRSWPAPARPLSTLQQASTHRADRVRAGHRSGRLRLVNSLAQPGGNATGFLQFEYDLAGKWLELLKEVAPQVTARGRVARPGAPRRHRTVGRHPGVRRAAGRGVEPDRSAGRSRRSSAPLTAFARVAKRRPDRGGELRRH